MENGEFEKYILRNVTNLYHYVADVLEKQVYTKIDKGLSWIQLLEYPWHLRRPQLSY